MVNDVMAVDVKDSIPACSFNRLEKEISSLDLKQFSGKVIYLDFWASWCGPCIKSFPYMNFLHRSFENQGLNVVAVNMDENIDDASEFLEKIPAEFSILRDAEQQCAKAFDVKAMPSSYLIDRKGVVRHVHLGFREGETEELQALIEQLLAE